MDLDLAALLQKEIAIKKQTIQNNTKNQKHKHKHTIDKNKELKAEKENAHERNENILEKVIKEQEETSNTDGYTIEQADFQNMDLLSEKVLKYLHKILLTDLPAYFKKEEEEEVEEDDKGEREDNPVIIQTKINLFPLLMKLRIRTLESDLLVSLSTTLYHLQNKQEKQCLESYMKLSIGNLIWPIGVEQIGIHAKFNNSNKLKKKSNVIISEESRLWITTIKRLITIEFKLCKL